MAESKNRNVSHKKRQTQSFVRVALPDDVGGGFITLRCDPNTDDAELKRLALEHVKAKRMTQAYSATPITIRGNLKVQGSRVNLVIPKHRDPRIEKRIRSLISQKNHRKDKNVKLTFYPGPIGITGKGNYVTEVDPQSQAHGLGVSEGWRLLAVNGVPMTSAKDISVTDAIEAALKKTSSGRNQNQNIQITFAPGSMRVGTEVVLGGLKTHATYNGAEGIIIRSQGNEKYDVSLTSTSLKTTIRGIHGTYLQLKHQQQYWRVVCPLGVRIKRSLEKRSDIVGTLHYGTILIGLHHGNWVKHDQGFSRIRNSRTGREYLRQDSFCKYGILWPINLIRKELYFQICKDYEERRVDLTSIKRAAAVRQRELEEQDSKKKSVYSHKQWKKFWKRQNPHFAAYYRRLYSENKKKNASGTNTSEQKGKDLNRESDLLSFPTPLDIYTAPFEDSLEEEDAKEANEAEIDTMVVKQDTVDTPRQENEQDILDFMSM